MYCIVDTFGYASQLSNVVQNKINVRMCDTPMYILAKGNLGLGIGWDFDINYHHQFINELINESEEVININ